MHAWQALVRGHEVVQIERELEARGASVREFGLVWVSGRPPPSRPQDREKLSGQGPAYRN
jgi:hypothetical protein